MFNIVFNAVQAMPYGGDLVVTTALDDETNLAVLEITDTGVGIPADKLEQIFAPFYTDKSRGTGLGLCIARSIIEKHGGRIAVRSRPGDGSTFTVTLPAGT